MTSWPVVFEYSYFCAKSLAAWRLLDKRHYDDVGSRLQPQLSLECLERIRFPWTAPAYVFGLNGEYFSHDSLEPHCGIPKGTLPALAHWFSSCNPNFRFTSVKIHQFDSSRIANKHKTLAFKQVVEAEVIYVAALGDYKGGSLHVKKMDDGNWCSVPLSTRWQSFEAQNLQQVTWPSSGTMYLVSVWCESFCHWENLTAENRRYLLDRGIPGPEYPEMQHEGHLVTTETTKAFRRRILPRHVLASQEVRDAISILGLDASMGISVRHIRRRFQECILRVHPDNAARHRAKERLCMLNDRGYSPASASPSDTTAGGDQADDSANDSPWSGRSRGGRPEELLALVHDAESHMRLWDAALVNDLVEAKHVLYDALQYPGHSRHKNKQKKEILGLLDLDTVQVTG